MLECLLPRMAARSRWKNTIRAISSQRSRYDDPRVMSIWRAGLGSTRNRGKPEVLPFLADAATGGLHPFAWTSDDLPPTPRAKTRPIAFLQYPEKCLLNREQYTSDLPVFLSPLFSPTHSISSISRSSWRLRAFNVPMANDASDCRYLSVKLAVPRIQRN